MQTEKVRNDGLWLSCLWIKRKMIFFYLSISIYLLVVVYEELFGIEQYNDFPALKSLSEYLLIY